MSTGFLSRAALIVAPLLAAMGCGPVGARDGDGLCSADITDAAGFAQPIAAAIVRTSADWQPHGGVAWDRRTNCVSNQLRVEWSARSPDGSRAFDYRDRPDRAETAARAAPATDARVRRRHVAGDLLIGYSAGGVELREVLSTTVVFSEVQGNVMSGVGMVFLLRAPSEQFDPALGERIAASIKINPHWLAMARDSTNAAEPRFSSNQRNEIARWHAAEMARINASGAADRAAIRAQANRDVAKINADTNAGAQTTNDRIQRRTLEGIGEYNTFRGADGTLARWCAGALVRWCAGALVRSSIHGGARVLQHPEGSHTSTDDPYYNPAGSQQLKRVR